MKVLLINGSPRHKGNTNLDEEGLQTVRVLSNNMAWMLKKLHGIPTTDQPEREDRTPMNFIR